jgi:hypothetical protein
LIIMSDMSLDSSNGMVQYLLLLLYQLRCEEGEV